MLTRTAAVLVTLALPLVAAPAAAQHVDARIVISTGPVLGPYAPPPARVIVIERMPDRGRHRGWWKHHRDASYRTVTVYQDGDRYYDRERDERPGLREVIVYERNGHYYRDNDDEDHGHGHGHHDD